MKLSELRIQEMDSVDVVYHAAI